MRKDEMPPSKKPDLYQAKDTFSVVQEDGIPVVVDRGDLVRAGHPLLKGREHLFEPVEQAVRFDVEQATAAPGEKRGK